MQFSVFATSRGNDLHEQKKLLQRLKLRASSLQALKSNYSEFPIDNRPALKLIHDHDFAGTFWGNYLPICTSE
jgi:hypothetical protein